ILSEDDLVSVYSIGQNKTNANELIIGTYGKGAFKSSDKGANWNELSVPLNPDATVYSVEYSSNGNVYLASDDGFFFSSDGGSTWNERNNGLPHNKIWNMELFENGASQIIFITLITVGVEGDESSFKGGIYKSEDDGNSWSNISGDLPVMQSDGMFYYYWKFTVNTENPNSIYIGTSVGSPDESASAYEEWGVYKTENGGISWRKTDYNVSEGWMDQSFFDERHALVLSIAPSDTNTIYWGRDWMYKSTDAGNSWKQIYTVKKGDAWTGNGFELMMTEDIAFSPSDPDKIFVGYDDMGPFRSTDGGVSFKPLDSKMDPYDGYDAAKDIFVDPENGDVYLSRYDGVGSALESGFSLGRIYKSVDDGDSFTEISGGFPDGRPDLAIDFSAGTPGNRTLYAASYGNGVFKSTNSGERWFSINEGLSDDAAGAWTIKINPNNNEELFLGINNFGEGGGLYKTTDGGNSWFSLTSFPAYDVLSIEIDNRNIIYCGATENYDWSVSGGLYKSSDGGNSWNEIFDYPRIADIAISPVNPDLLFIVSQPWYDIWLPDVMPGIFKSTDAGENWTNITTDLAHTYALFAKIDPHNPSRLFVGTGGGGLWVNDNVTSVENEINDAPEEFILYQNFPNPFRKGSGGNAATTIDYSIPMLETQNPDKSGQVFAPQRVILKLYDVLGREIATLVNKEQTPGNYSIRFNGQNLSPGVYLYSITVSGVTKKFRQTKKMLLLR
ncbi:MAG: hypothetical protein GXO87_02450, partial [Chlorobi bacterium]|nr:hypothetical protein [Chlorobiota bacterium]